MREPITYREKVLYIIANDSHNQEFLARKLGMTPDQVHEIYKAVFDAGMYTELWGPAQEFRIVDPYRRLGTFTDRFRKLLAKKRETKTIKQISEEMGVKLGTIYKYTETNQKPHRSTLIKIAAYFEVSPEWLLTGKKEGEG